MLPFDLAPINVVVGHYGVGKTNFSLNVAVDAARAGIQVTLADLDVVNPYFRSSEYRALLEDAGVRVIAPVFSEAGSSLDVPSLTGAVVPAIEEAYADGARSQRVVIIDAGGDDAGAFALGRFARHIAAGPFAMLYVVNCYRNLTQHAREAADVLREIERACHLQATGVVSNAHLKADTTAEVVVKGAAFAREVADAVQLPLVCTTAPKLLTLQENDATSTLSTLDNLYPVEALVRTPWEA